MRRSVAAALAACLTALAIVAVPAAAAGQPDASYARFAFPGGGGLVIATYNGATNVVNAGFVGLVANKFYVLTGRSIGCGGTPSSANKLFQMSIQGDADGDADVDGNDFLVWQKTLRSVWLEPANHSSAARCSGAVNVALGDVNGDGALGIWDKEHVLSVIEKRPSNQALLTITFNGGSGDDQIQYRGLSVACSAASPASVTLFTRITAARYSSGLINLTPTQINSLKSVRARDLTTGAQMGCYPLSIIAVLIG